MLSSKTCVILSSSYCLSAVGSFCQSFILISISILCLTNSRCPPDALHSHNVEMDSALRCSASARVGVWWHVIFTNLSLWGGALSNWHTQVPMTPSLSETDPDSSDQRAHLLTMLCYIRHCRHHNRHSCFLSQTKLSRLDSLPPKMSETSRLSLLCTGLCQSFLHLTRESSAL